MGKTPHYANAEQMARAEEARSKKRRRANWVFRISLSIFILSMVALGVIGVNYLMGQSKYEKIAHSAFSLPSDKKLLTLEEVSPDWKALRAINPDTIAWVYVPDTGMSFPIVQDTNSTYLKTDFYGETNRVVSYGAIFLDEECASTFSSQNNCIYGHNMNNGAMFHNLENYTEQRYFNDHRTVYIFTPAGNMRLTAFAFDHVSAYSEVTQSTVEAPKTMADYVNERLRESLFAQPTNMPAVADIDKTINLITCDNLPSDGRYVLCCYVAESTIPTIKGLETGSGPGIDPSALTLQ